MTSPYPTRTTPVVTSARVLAVLWIVAHFAVRGALDGGWVTGSARWVVALLPLPLFLGWLVQMRRVLRGLDELESRMHLEALAIAFPLTLALLMTLGLLQLAGPLKAEDWSYRHLWPFLASFYVAGLAIARRRYA